jgi:2-methylcitrate dehydratase PrpD
MKEMAKSDVTTDELIAFVSDPGLESAASSHFAAAIRAMTDTVAVMVAGADSPAAAIMHETLAELGSGTSSVVGSGNSLPLLDAISVNATAAHALDFDDTIQGLTTHPSCHLVPALLGLAAEFECSGPQLLASYLVGLQVEHSLSAALGKGTYQRGWHSTSTVGTVATAAAAARILQLETAQVRAAISTAASAAAGLRANFGTMVKPVHVGRAARAGVESALLARRGLTASHDALRHRFGLLGAMGAQPGADTEVGDLTRFPVLSRLAFKPYPCCGEALGAVEASVALHPRASSTELPRAEIYIGPFAREILEFDVPQTVDQARFSPTYCVWTALRTGGLTINDFSEVALAAATAESFADKLTVLVSDQLPHDRSAEVVLLTSGQRLSQRVDVPRGDPSAGFSDADVRQKYLACLASRIDQTTALNLLDRLYSLGSADRVGDLISQLSWQRPGSA